MSYKVQVVEVDWSQLGGQPWMVLGDGQVVWLAVAPTLSRRQAEDARVALKGYMAKLHERDAEGRASYYTPGFVTEALLGA